MKPLQLIDHTSSQPKVSLWGEGGDGYMLSGITEVISDQPEKGSLLLLFSFSDKKAAVLPV